MLGHVGDNPALNTFGPRSIGRQWRLVAVCGVLSLIAGLLFVALKPAQYTSSTQLLVYVRQLQTGQDSIISVGRADLTQVQNEIELILSRGMLAKVVGVLKLTEDREVVPAKTLLRTLVERIIRGPETMAQDSGTKLERAVEFLEKHVTAKRVGTSHTILVSVTTSDPNKSVRIANAIGQVAIESRVSAELEGIRSPLLRERLQGLGPSAYVISAAGTPGRPDGPRKSIVIPAALLFGLAVGALLALIRDLMNRTVRTAAQVESFGLECIGAIPSLQRRSPVGSDPSEQSVHELVGVGGLLPNSMQDQTIRRAMTAIAESKARVVGITSAVVEEGVSTVATHLARMAARSHKKVLLVEVGPGNSAPGTREEDHQLAGSADRRRLPGGIVSDQRAGLDVLKVDSADRTPGIAPWRTHCDPDRLDMYDLVIIDMPALESGPEFRMAAQDVEGILLVIKWGSTEFDRVGQAIAGSGVAPAEFIGAVLNNVDDRMIGKFGDKFWKAEAVLVAERRPFGLSMPAERPVV